MTRPPRTLPIRRWLVIALVVALAVPFMATGFVATNIVFREDEQDRVLDDASSFLKTNAERWDDPAWQDAARSRLTSKGVDFILYSGTQELFRSTDLPVDPDENRTQGPPWDDDAGRTAYGLQVDGSTPLQTALYFGPENAPARAWLLPLVALSTLALTLTGIGLLVGRMVVRPLRETGGAARRFATGDMDAALPASRVREVAEVNAAFDAMRSGLRESLAQQANLEQERLFFIGAVAHDLRTPLFSLRGYLSGLEQGVADTPEKRARYLAVAQEKADALERLVADLFDYTRLEFLELSPAREPLDLGELLAKQVESIEPPARERGITLDASGLGGCTIDGDSHLLSRVVENLLDNALRHTPDGGTIRASCGGTGSAAWFRIADSGPGIPAEDLPHIFDAMFRGETSRNSRTGGAGLGLAIARRIMRAHGGELRAGEAAGGGAEFTATLGTSSQRYS